MLDRVRQRREPWDLVIVGGGATGLGIALDAATRGYSVLLAEQFDFGKGTSSRSTKLVHGGVRYLEQGRIGLVGDALRERERMRRNAPHLVHPMNFVIPCYRFWEAPYYGVGLRAYDFLAASKDFPRSHSLSPREVSERMPDLKTDGLKRGVVYSDGQFDDARYLVQLAWTAAEHGAVVVNYLRVAHLERLNAQWRVGMIDGESQETFDVPAKVVINAAGPYVDAVRALIDRDPEPMVQPSQGAHIVVRSELFRAEDALLIPKTPDGRVLFAIPWYSHVVIGTTDTPVESLPYEPFALETEIEFLLETAQRYFSRRIARADISAVFTGIRPLVRGNDASTAALSRDHVIRQDSQGFLTICGGKWTTYRKMAEDCVDHAAEAAGLPKNPCVTATLRLHGYSEAADMGPYGSDAALVEQLDPTPLGTGGLCTVGMVRWAARFEMARTVEDVLARRTRWLFLNAQEAVDAAPQVLSILAEELGRDVLWQTRQIAEFRETARAFLPLLPANAET